MNDGFEDSTLVRILLIFVVTVLFIVTIVGVITHLDNRAALEKGLVQCVEGDKIYWTLPDKCESGK